MSNRQRNIRIQLRVTEQEKALIDQKNAGAWHEKHRSLPP